MGVKAVQEHHEIMIITTEGIIIRLKVSDISTLGRNTSGVKLINIDGDSDVRWPALPKYVKVKTAVRKKTVRRLLMAKMVRQRYSRIRRM